MFMIILPPGFRVVRTSYYRNAGRIERRLVDHTFQIGVNKLEIDVLIQDNCMMKSGNSLTEIRSSIINNPEGE
jgi:hypothetical protein